MVLICLFAFLGIVAVTRYVSLGSLAVVIIYLIEVVVYGQMGGFGVKPPYLYEMYGIAAFLMLSAFYKHKANIVRLMNGTKDRKSTWCRLAWKDSNLFIIWNCSGAYYMVPQLSFPKLFSYFRKTFE